MHYPFVLVIFAYMNKEENIKLSENFIIADADYADHVAFDLIVNFERMLGRRIPNADLAKWIVGIALDGGMRNKGEEQETQVVLVHDKEKGKMENFTPASYGESSGKAFKDPTLGEFIVNAYPVENVTSKDEYMLDLIETVCSHKEVKRVMIIPNTDTPELYDKIRMLLKRVDDEDKHITVFAMQPLQGGNFKQEILGYSLMNAMEIKGDEFK